MHSYQEGERDDWNRDDRVCLAKTSNITWWERENRQRPWIFFLVFCFISNILVCWIASSLGSFVDYSPQNLARKLSPPNLCGSFSTIYLYSISSRHRILRKWVRNLLSFLLRCGTRPYERGHPMRLELTRVGLLVELANHYTTRGASYENESSCSFHMSFQTTRSLTWTFGDCLLIYLLIYSFNFDFIWAD